MNWVQLVTNVLGAAVVAFGAAYAATHSWEAALSAALGAVASNLTGLFQPQPHKEQP